MNQILPMKTIPRQQGAVLIIAMIFLIILTLLAVTGMNTTSLEEKMAANSQETNRAFQAAETGLAEALENDNAYDLSGTFSIAVATIPGPTTSTRQYQTQLLDDSRNPPLVLNDPEVSSVSCFQAAFFNLQSTGNSAGGVTLTINGGAWQVIKAKNTSC